MRYDPETAELRLTQPEYADLKERLFPAEALGEPGAPTSTAATTQVWREFLWAELFERMQGRANRLVVEQGVKR